MKVVTTDDSVFMRRLIHPALLESLPQAQVEELGVAPLALAALPALVPELITRDILMPGMGDLTFPAQLPATRVRAQVIVISADSQKTVRQKCAELGATDFVEKPVTLGKLPVAPGNLIAA